MSNFLPLHTPRLYEMYMLHGKKEVCTLFHDTYIWIMLQVFVENKVLIPSGSQFITPPKGTVSLAQHVKTEMGITYLLTELHAL